jgi:predicted metal-dependent phosphoesterase TrpH
MNMPYKGVLLYTIESFLKRIDFFNRFIDDSAAILMKVADLRMWIDLQIHTVATPHHAAWEPEALVLAAKAANLAVIAVTDHNTTACVQATLEAGACHGIRVIAGVEIDSGFPSGGRAGAPLKMWHTLIYGAPPEHPELLALCDSVFERNRSDAVELREELARRGMPVQGLDDLGRSANVADVATALARQYELPGRLAGEDDEAAGMRYVLEQVPGGYKPVGVDEVIALAHRIGGLAVLAHPGRSKGIYAIPADEEDIRALKACGLDGIEVFYPSHSEEQKTFLLDMAQRYDLLVTGGSDSHGPHQAFAHWPAAACQHFLDTVS